MSLILLLATSLCSMSFAQENPYDLLDSLDPASANVQEEERMPASVNPDQLTVRKNLPEAKREKTAGALQWELLKTKPKATEQLEEESHHE